MARHRVRCAHSTAGHIAWLGSWARTWRVQCPQRRSGAAVAHSRPHTSPGCHRPTVASLRPQAPRPSPPRCRTRPGTWAATSRDVPAPTSVVQSVQPTLDHVGNPDACRLQKSKLSPTVSASLASLLTLGRKRPRLRGGAPFVHSCPPRHMIPPSGLMIAGLSLQTTFAN